MNSILHFSYKVDWRELVWHKYAIPLFRFYLMAYYSYAFYTQDTLIAYGSIQASCCHLYGGCLEDIDHIFIDCSYLDYILLKFCAGYNLPHTHCS